MTHPGRGKLHHVNNATLCQILTTSNFNSTFVETTQTSAGLVLLLTSAPHLYASAGAEITFVVIMNVIMTF